MLLRDRLLKLSLVMIFLGATSLIIVLAGDMTAPEKKSAKNMKNEPLQKKKGTAPTPQVALVLTDEEKLVLTDLISFIDKIPKNLAARIGQIEIQLRPPSSELKETYQRIFNSEKITPWIVNTGDLLLNIEILSMENNSIFLGSLESIKTKNRIYELSWQKKTR